MIFYNASHLLGVNLKKLVVTVIMFFFSGVRFIWRPYLASNNDKMQATNESDVLKINIIVIMAICHKRILQWTP